MATGTWTYTKRWDLPTATNPVGASIPFPGATLLLEQTLINGRGDNGAALRFNDSDTGVPIPNGIKRLAMVIRVDTIVGGAAADKVHVGLDIKPPLATRFYTVQSAQAATRFVGGGTVPDNTIEVWNFGGKITTAGGAFNSWLGVAPATEAATLTDNRNNIGLPTLIGGYVRPGWGFTHGAVPAGTFALTVQVWGIYEA